MPDPRDLDPDAGDARACLGAGLYRGQRRPLRAEVTVRGYHHRIPGRYLVWGQTREVEFENYADALLASLKTTIDTVRKDNNWQPRDRVRLVFHVYKPLKRVEIDAIKQLVQELLKGDHEVEFAFLDISRFRVFPAEARELGPIGVRRERHAFVGETHVVSDHLTGDPVRQAMAAALEPWSGASRGHRSFPVRPRRQN
ncbi:hypothetical protein [Pseudorhodoplanes sp.]|uniref:hypothetical protein n=1 Tax=Pseudorhodoplanes sp. TaxID=1934341 RepID=UPI003D0F9246